MIKNGKKLESLVKLIQETLKDSSNTIIYSNKKVKNVGGSKREFDVFIEGNLSGFPIKIAIECKDYATAVSVEKIEAFQAKCSRIPDINKKIFVATNGYQRDAIKAAKEFGMELYNIADIDVSAIHSWLPIKQLGLRFQVTDYNFFLDADEKVISKLNEPERKCWFEYQGKYSNVLNLINEYIINHKKLVWAHAKSNLMRNSGKEKLGGVLTLTFKLNLNDAFIVSDEDLKAALKEINGTFNCFLVESNLAIITSKDFSTQNESKAKYIEFDHGNNGKVEVVVTPNNYKFFHTDHDGETIELVTLGFYDPKQDKFIPTNTDGSAPQA